MKKINLLFCIFFSLFLSDSAVAVNSPAATLDPITSSVTAKPVAVDSRAGVIINADINSDLTVIKIELYYRAIGADNYTRVTMHADRNGEYRYTVNREELDYPGLEYYIVALDFQGNSLLHGNANFPLIANFENGWGSRVVVKKPESLNNLNRKVVRADWLTTSNSVNNPLWKNKWLWVGLGVLAGAYIANDSGDDNTSTKPAFSIVVEGPAPEPSTP